MLPKARARWKPVFSWTLREWYPSSERSLPPGPCPEGAGRLWARPSRRGRAAPRRPGEPFPTEACLAGRQAELGRGPPQGGAEPAGGTLPEPGAGGLPKPGKVLPGMPEARKTWAAPGLRQARAVWPEMKPGRQALGARARKKRAARAPGRGLPEARPVRTAPVRRVSRKPGRQWCGRAFPAIRGAAAGRGSGAGVPARRTARGW